MWIRRLLLPLLATVVPAAPLLSGCDGDDACECIRGYGSASMSGEDIVRLADQGIAACFNTNDSEELEDQADCLPIAAGKDARNGAGIEVYYYCSDVCPDAGRVSVRYEGVSEADCCAIGGSIETDPAWKSYEGCVPPELSSQQNPCP